MKINDNGEVENDHDKLERLLLEQKIYENDQARQYPPMHRQLEWDPEVYELVAIDTRSGRVLLGLKTKEAGR